MEKSYVSILEDVNTQVSKLPKREIKGIAPCYIIYKTSWGKYEYYYAPSDCINIAMQSLGNDTEIVSILYSVYDAIKAINSLNAPKTLKRSCGSGKVKKVIAANCEIWEG